MINEHSKPQEPMNKYSRTVFAITDGRYDQETEVLTGTIREMSYGDLVREYADETTSPRGVGPRFHIRNERELWTWGRTVISPGSFGNTIPLKRRRSNY